MGHRRRLFHRLAVVRGRRFLVVGGGGGDFSRRQRSKEEEAQNDDDDDEEEILQHRRREQKNKTNATTKRHSREHYLREDIFCGIKQAPVEYKGKDETNGLDVEEKEEKNTNTKTRETPRQETKRRRTIRRVRYTSSMRTCVYTRWTCYRTRSL